MFTKRATTTARKSLNPPIGPDGIKKKKKRAKTTGGVMCVEEVCGENQ